MQISHFDATGMQQHKYRKRQYLIIVKLEILLWGSFHFFTDLSLSLLSNCFKFACFLFVCLLKVLELLEYFVSLFIYLMFT